MTTPQMDNQSGELDRLIDGLPANLPEDERKLAEDLMHQAKSNPPDPRFVNDLSHQLRQNHPGVTNSRPVRRSMWLALAGSVVVILVTLFGLPFLQKPVLPIAIATTPSAPETSAVQSPSIQPTSLPVLPLLGPSSVMASANLSEQFPECQLDTTNRTAS